MMGAARAKRSHHTRSKAGKTKKTALGHNVLARKLAGKFLKAALVLVVFCREKKTKANIFILRKNAIAPRPPTKRQAVGFGRVGAAGGERRANGGEGARGSATKGGGKSHGHGLI